MKLLFEKLNGNKFCIHTVVISNEEVDGNIGGSNPDEVRMLKIAGALLVCPSDTFIFMGGYNNLRVSWESIIEKISKNFSSITSGETNFQFTFKDEGDEAAFNFYLYDGIEI